MLWEEYLKVERDNSSLHGEEFDIRSWSNEPAVASGNILGCAELFEGNGGQGEGKCWPRLESVWAESTKKLTKLPSKMFADTVNKVRPGYYHQVANTQQH